MHQPFPALSAALYACIADVVVKPPSEITAFRPSASSCSTTHTATINNLLLFCKPQCCQAQEAVVSILGAQCTTLPALSSQYSPLGHNVDHL